MAKKGIVKCKECGEVHDFVETYIGACIENHFYQDDKGNLWLNREKYLDSDDVNVKCANCGADLDEMELKDKNGDDTMRQRLYTLYGKTLDVGRKTMEADEKRIKEILMALQAHVMAVKDILDGKQSGDSVTSLKAIAGGVVEIQDKFNEFLKMFDKIPMGMN